jgi:acetyltransferase
VAAVDAMADTCLTPMELPADLRAAIDTLLPPRWSGGNPIDMAGGETRDTVPEVLELVAGHPDVDSIVLLGIGIQSNTAAMMRAGPFFPDHGLERIVGYHERQDARYAEAAAAISARTGTPILVATELAVARPDNPGPAAVRANGRFCHASASRAVRSLHLISERAAWLSRRSIGP